MKAITNRALTLVRKFSSEPLFISLSGLHPWFTKFIPHPAYYPSPDNIVVKRDGAKFSINRSDWMQWHIYACQPDWSWKHALRYLLDAKKHSPVVLDIGSNVGAFSFKLAANLKKKGMPAFSLFAVDPNPYVQDRFLQNQALNDFGAHIHFSQLAISDADGISRFEFTNENTGGGSISSRGIEVPVLTLDSFCAKNKIDRLDFIKIDVEGFEPYVVDGGREIFSVRRPAVYMEISPVWYRQKGRNAHEIFDFLYGLGYRIFKADEKECEPILKETLEQQLENFQFNILGLPK